MYKLVVLAVVCANGLFWGRDWQPRRGRLIWLGLRGSLWGALMSCLIALGLAVLRPGPFHLAIYFVSLGMLLIPTWAAFFVIRGVRLSQPEKGPSFAEVMQSLEGPSAPSANAPVE